MGPQPATVYGREDACRLRLTAFLPCFTFEPCYGQLAAALDNGCSAWSEQFAPSYCAAVEGFVLEPFKAVHMPPHPQRQYGPGGRVSEDEFVEMCRDPATQGVLVHALKW